MANFIEPLICRGIDKDTSPGGLDYSNRRQLNPLRDVLNGRYLSSENGDKYKVENIKGTIIPEPDVEDASIAALSTGFNQGPNAVSWSPSSTPSIFFPSTPLGQKAYSKVYALLMTDGLQGIEYTFNYNITISHTGAGYNAFFKVGLFNEDFSLSNIVQEFVVFSDGVHSGDVSVSFASGTPKYVGLLIEKTGLSSNVTLTVNSFTYASSDYSFDLPAGTNKCVGWYENVEKNYLVYFNWNSNDDHGIYRYTPDTKTHAQIISGSLLNFNGKPITGIDMIGDLLSWCDLANEVRYINVTRSYGTLNDQKISLSKIGPRTAPVFTARADDSNITYNRLTGDSFQFAHQYVYLDNEESVMSPISKLCTADLFPATESTERAKVQVTHTIDTEVMDIIKEVRLLYRKNNDPSWYVWKKVTSFSSTINEYFFNNEQGTIVPSTTTAKLFDLVPVRSRALVIFRNRVFVNVNEDGYTFNPPTITATLATDYENTPHIGIENIQSRGAFVKKNGTYLAGVFFRDSMGRLSGITSKAYVNGNKWLIPDSTNLNFDSFLLPIPLNNVSNKINVTLAGAGPPNSQYFIALTEEQNFAEYIQVPVHIFWYEIDINNTESVGGQVVFVPKDSTRSYFEIIPPIPDASYSYIHLLLPKELSFMPTTDHYVRFAGTAITKITKVLEVLDGKIIVIANPLSDPNTTAWSSLNWAYKGVPLLEIFKLKNTVDPFFYQVMGPYNTDENGALETTSIQNIDADTWYLPLREWNYDDFRFTEFQKIGAVSDFRHRQLTPTLHIEAKTPTTKQSQLNSTITVQTLSDAMRYLSEPRPEKILTPDLEKSAWSKGWSLVEAKAELSRKPTTIRFSDPYIEGSKVNGLNSFPSDNEYNKIGEDRSPITKLLAVGDILLSIHERNVTSLYVGQSILKSGDQNLEALSDSVIGDDRLLIGNYGSYHPESVQGVDGQAFGWDIFKGCVWRYTVEGLLDISQFGLQNYFREKANIYAPYRDTVNFVACIDRYHKEYLIVFPTIADVIEGETWAYNYKEKVWAQRYSFTPEMMASLGNKIYGFVDGVLHEHNASDTHNNFYGEQYERSLTFECNPQPNKVKVWKAIQVAGDTLADDDAGTKQVVQVENEEGQESYIRAKEFEKKEGVYYGPILKDINTNPLLLSAGQIALRDGKDMRSKTLKVTISNDDTGRALLQKVNIVGQDSEYSI